MVYVILAVLGLCLGSFVNALVWRLHENKSMQGRSMCPHCHHQLASKDLVPVLSWLSLRGKCRYCGKKISVQYPLVELGTALAFIASYAWWPLVLGGWQTVIFVLWLAILTGLMALLVYDLRWYLLPNRLVYPLTGLAVVMAAVRILSAPNISKEFLYTILAVLVGGGIFYTVFQLSKGKWIGGGDVKLGWLLGLVVGTPGRAVLLIFLASVMGSAVSLPLLANHKLKRTSVIPFGPFLILAAAIVVLFGGSILAWYKRTFITF